jgi:hypothetical protein
MKSTFSKIKTEHHILAEFHPFLRELETLSQIQRIIPGRIDRKQKKSSIERFRISYTTSNGTKCIMSKWSTAQELFIIHNPNDKQYIDDYIAQLKQKYRV